MNGSSSNKTNHLTNECLTATCKGLQDVQSNCVDKGVQTTHQNTQLFLVSFEMFGSLHHSCQSFHYPFFSLQRTRQVLSSAPSIRSSLGAGNSSLKYDHLREQQGESATKLTFCVDIILSWIWDNQQKRTTEVIRLGIFQNWIWANDHFQLSTLHWKKQYNPV